MGGCNFTSGVSAAGRSLITVGVLAAITAGTGCETVGEDFADFANSLVPKSPFDAARMAVDPTDPDQRRQGLVLLSNAPFGGAEPYLKLYRDYSAGDPDPIVRAVSVRALARHGAPEDAPIVAANLTHENAQVRWEAAKGLQRLHYPPVVSNMLAVLRHEEEARIRAAIACGLGQYPEDRVFQTLLSGLDASELSVNLAAQESLKTLTGLDFGLEPREWLGWYNRVVRVGDPFAGGRDYLYPTYQRKETLLETLAFWSSNSFEQPAPPAGLRPSTERRTYEDSEDEGADRN